MRRRRKESSERIKLDLKAEVNSLIFPLFIFSPNRGETEITLTGTIREGNRAVKFLWRVTSPPNVGLPTAFDWQVFRAIEDIIGEMPKPVENPIKFSFYQVCEKMRARPHGEIYRKIRKSIERIALTSIQSKRAFYLKEKRKRITTGATFHLYESYVFVDEELPDGTVADANYLWLNPFYLSNINRNYVKPMDKEYYWSLKKPLSRRLYEILSLKFYGMSDLKDSSLQQSYALLCELIRITPQRYFSLAKKVLDPAHDELIETGFLSSAEWEKKGKKPQKWFILYTPGPRAIAEISRARGRKLELPEPELTDEQEMALSALQERGVITKIAKQLVREHDLEKIWEVIRYVDWYKKQPNRVQNWGAYIAELIKDPEFSPPQKLKRDIEREEERKRMEELERKAMEILEDRVEEALRSWSDEEIIRRRLERALRAREMLVKAGMGRPYTPQEIEELRREIENSLPKTEEERRRWLILNGGEKFDLRAIIEELEEEDL